MLNWYLETTNEDTVISTRIRIARNISGIPFINKMTQEDAYNVINTIKNAIQNINYGLKIFLLKDMHHITKLSLIEKHIISPEFALNKTNLGAIAINEEENICIMINEEDHLRIQTFSAGLNLENALYLATEIEKKLGENINYAYNEKYGFLTSCPSNVGTALRTSIMMHLPALTKTKNIGKVLNVLNSFEMNIRGVYGEGTSSKGNIYQISNKQTLGVTEEETIQNLKAIIDRLIEQEKLGRKMLTKKPIELEDEIYRAYGIFTNCRKISSDECTMLLSKIRLGVDLGIIKEITNAKVNKLEIYTKPANLQKQLGQVMDGYTRDIKRADIIKQIICE